MRVLIIGGGVMGLSAAWALRRAGHSVALFDQNEIPNPHGSSVDDHRLIRFPYGASDGYCRMVMDAFAAWDRLWLDLGARHYAQTGTLALSAGGGDWGDACRASLDRCGIAYDLLSPALLADRFPFLETAGLEYGLYLSSGGNLFARDIVRDLKKWLIQFGAEIQERRRVARVNLEKAKIHLADGQTVAGDFIIVAAGPWVTKLLSDMAARVTPSRQLVQYVMAPPDYRAAWAHGPMVLEIASDRGFYAVPPRAGYGLKIGDHRFSLMGDPDAPRAFAPGEAEALMQACAHRLRHFDRYERGPAKICFYDVEPQERFIVEPLSKRSLVLSGFSGHGFKFGALIGEKVADYLSHKLSAPHLQSYAAGQI